MTDILNSVTQPKDAAAVILLRQDTDPDDPQVFWVKRSAKLAFLGGFYAFPGGQLDPTDATARVVNATDSEAAAMISCGARELFEETGVLLARGAESLTIGQRASLLDDLESGRMTWPELLAHYGLHLDREDFTFVGRWVTPPFAPRRFDTWFFLARCPAKQEPAVTGDAELEKGEWIAAGKALLRWERCEALAAPPVLHALKTLANGLTEDLVHRFLSVSEAHREPTRRMEFQPNYICFPVRTRTLPPATHTNCYLIYSSREILIIDPGSTYEEEQAALAACVDDLTEGGRIAREILLTHLHPDHIGGVQALKGHLQDKYGAAVPVAAHRETSKSLNGEIRIDRFIEDNEILALQGEPPIRLRALHTPGHARGHLCFHDERSGALISGDNVVGFGSVLINPPEGDMRAYLHSLERMREIDNLSVLFGGHGPAIASPYEKIEEYISHRLEREQLILSAVREGAATPKEIVARAYLDVSPKAHAMAERAVLAHLEKLADDRLVARDADGNYLPG